MGGKERIGVGVRGAGTVGGGVIRELQLHGQEWGIELRGVAVENPSKPDREFKGPHYTTGKDLLSDDLIRIIVEAPGGVTPEDSRDFMLDAMDSGRSVVTPAKAPIALFAPGLFEAARSRSVDLKFEGTVGGGIPVINPMLERVKVDRIQEIKGIVNGTTNYMLTEMARKVKEGKKRGISFKSVLNEAIKVGYAETNPADDIEGRDVAYKLAIMSMLGFRSWVDPKSISTRGITDITPADLEFASEYITDEAINGHTIKLLAIAKRSKDDDSIELRATPALISNDHQLARISGVFNAVYLDWELAGPQMITGRGAGREATTSAVLDDLKRAKDNLETGPDEIPSLDQAIQRKNPQDVVIAGYVRMYLKHIPGSAGIAYTILGLDDGLNLKDISQKEKFKKIVNGEVYKTDIVTFEPIEQWKVDRAIIALRKSDRVTEHPVFIPFEE